MIKESLIFEKITNSKDMILPKFYKPILVESSHEENNKFIKELYKTYKNEIKYKDLLNQIVRVKDIPVELLSKYFARIYTIDEKFFQNMKMALLEGNEDNEGNKVSKKISRNINHLLKLYMMEVKKEL